MRKPSTTFERLTGVASLLVAKLHKIAERKDDADRLQDKDGLDVLRLLRFSPTSQLADTLKQLGANPISRQATQQAHEFLSELFGSRTAVGTQMAVRATVGLEDASTIALSCEALTQRLLEAWK